MELIFKPFSVGNSGIDDMNDFLGVMEGLRNLDMLNVGDGELFEVVTNAALFDDVSIVLDLTFLHDFSLNKE